MELQTMPVQLTIDAHRIQTKAEDELAWLSEDEYSDPSLSCESSDEEETIPLFCLEASDFTQTKFIDSQCFPEMEPDVIKQHQLEEVTQLLSAGAIEEMNGKGIKDLRVLLGDWLFNLSFATPTNSETLFQSFRLLDSFLSRKHVAFNRLQLFACTCVWICAKVEVHSIASLEPLFKCCHGKFSKADFVMAEAEILSSVDFKIQSITPNLFLMSFLDKIEADSTMRSLSAFLCETSLLFISFCYFRPSMVAYASIICASAYLGYSDPSPLLSYSADFDKKDLSICIQLIHKASNYALAHKDYGVLRRFQKRCDKSSQIANKIERRHDLIRSLAHNIYK